jgi:membrane fusion protein, multidrug efflux system
MNRLWMLGVVLLVACTQAAEKAVEEVRPVRVVKIGVADSTRRVEYAGEVRARYETRLAFRVSGKITERMVDTGATVRRGQPVARIDASDLTLAVTSAKAQVASLESETALADAEYKRYRDLRERNFISQAEFDRRASTLSTAQSRLAAARAQERQAANQVGYATLVAETAGVVTAVEAEAGQVVAAGQTVAKVAQPGEKEVVLAIPESQVQFIQNSAAITVTLNAVPGKTWKGRLRELSPAADPATRTYPARITILAATDDVDLGMSARAVVEAAGGQAKRIEIPISALHSRGESAQVYLVGADGTVQPQAVKTAGVAGERVVVESGLNPGDVVVAAGASLLRPGQRVRVLNGK